MMRHTEIIQRLLNTYEEGNYLEIGVDRGDNFILINASHKVGVDPVPPSDLVQAAINEVIYPFKRLGSKSYQSRGDSR
jgi:hypothetical protein